MEQHLGLDIGNPVLRERFLKDNSEKVESQGYMKPFKPEEIERKKNRLAELSIEIADIEDEKASVVSNFKARMTPLKTERAEILSDIKHKSRYVTEQCFKFVDKDERMVGWYNKEGELVASRPAMIDELQLNLFTAQQQASEEDATGTGDNI